MPIPRKVARLAAATVVAASAVTLAGCSSKPPMTCRQRYELWATGPAKIPLHHLQVALHKVTSAVNNEDFVATMAAFRAIGRDATKLGRTPPPACADPAGYYVRLIGLIKAVSDKATAGGGSAASLDRARAPMSKLPAIKSKLEKELARTVGPTAPPPPG